MTDANRRAALRGLYAITPEVAEAGRLLRLVESALDGGARIVQFRVKSLARRDRLQRAQALLRLCRGRGVPLIVNDDLDLAQAIGADGVHVGREDPDPRSARERLPGAIIGVSCYDQPALALAAAQAGADYVGVGSVFASRTKPDAARAGLAALTRARRAVEIPVAAIGGINAGNAGEAVHAGADMIAVITALFDAPDVRAAARALSQPFNLQIQTHVRTQPAAI
jgi:thiamine-phosphate pyrophosphorylase